MAHDTIPDTAMAHDTIPYLVLGLAYIPDLGLRVMRTWASVWVPMDHHSYANLADAVDSYRLLERLYPDPEQLANISFWSHATPVWTSHDDQNPGQPYLTYNQLSNNRDIYLAGEREPLHMQGLLDLSGRSREGGLMERVEVGPITHAQMSEEPEDIYTPSLNVMREEPPSNPDLFWRVPPTGSGFSTLVSYDWIVQNFGPPPQSFRSLKRQDWYSNGNGSEIK